LYFGTLIRPSQRLLLFSSQEYSIISQSGRNVSVRRGQRQPRAYRFMVGDNSDISIL